MHKLRSVGYGIRYTTEEGYVRAIKYSKHAYSVTPGAHVSYTLRFLSPGRVYYIEVAILLGAYSYICGEYSDPVSFRTNALQCK